MRILAYAINSIGIGHLSRLIAITDAMRRLNNNLEILFLTEIADSRLLNFYNFPYYFLPPKKKILFDDEYSAMNQVQMTKLRESLLRKTVEVFQPHIILHDSLVDEDLFNEGQSVEAKQIFVSRRRNNMEEFLDQNEEKLSNMNLCVLTESEVSQEILSKKIPWYFSENIVRRTLSDIDPKNIINKYKIENKELVITISNGGGAEFKAFEDDYWNVVFEALKKFDLLNITAKVIGITGPMTKSTIIPPKYNNLETVLVDFEPRLIDLFYVSDLCIARGGYNTINELIAINSNAICIPAKRFSDNQTERIINTCKEVKNISYCNLEVEEVYKLLLEKYLKKIKKFSLTTTDKDFHLQTKFNIANKILDLASIPQNVSSVRSSKS